MIIKIDLKDNREITCNNSVIGKTFENNATILEFNLTEDMSNKDFYLEFEKPDESKFISSKLEVSTSLNEETQENEYYVIYEIPNTLLDIKGQLKLEVVLRNEDEVWKSYTLKFTILNSINATNELTEQYPDFVSEANKVIELIETNGEGNKFLSDDGIYKEVTDITGTTNYEELENKPFINKTGTEESPIYLRDLQTGGYVLTGVCKPFSGSDDSMVANNAITFVNWFDTVTAIQIFYPPYNQVQYFEIYDNTYTTNTVFLNNCVNSDYINNLIGDINTVLASLTEVS